MRTPLAKARASHDEWEPKYPFDILIAYEDVSTRNDAMKLERQLARQLQDDYDLQCSWWKFGHLEEPTLRARASDAAVEADMVILSVYAGRPLSSSIQKWIEEWAERRPYHKCALVALVTGAETGSAETQQLIARLHQVARQARMDFFPHLGLPQAAAACPPCGLAERATTVTATLLEILQHRTPAPCEGLREP